MPLQCKEQRAGAQGTDDDLRKSDIQVPPKSSDPHGRCDTPEYLRNGGRHYFHGRAAIREQMEKERIRSMQATDLLTHGVYLVGSSKMDKRNLMTAAWVAQAAGNAVILAVGQKHYTAQLICDSGHFSLSVLTVQQNEIARRCGSVSGRDTDKTAGVSLTLSCDGDPLLNGAAAHLSCRVVETVDKLDHIVFLGEIVEERVFSGTPMRYTK